MPRFVASWLRRSARSVRRSSVTSLLKWRLAAERGLAVKRDRAALQAFVCTNPPKAKWPNPHPREWELDVQSGIRGLRPPLGSDTVLALGEDAEGIGAVVLFSDIERDPSAVDLRAVAISCRLRWRGGHQYSEEAMTHAIELIQERARRAGCEEVVIACRIHRDNRASKTMCGNFGFEYLKDLPEDLEGWALSLPL